MTIPTPALGFNALDEEWEWQEESTDLAQLIADATLQEDLDFLRSSLAIAEAQAQLNRAHLLRCLDASKRSLPSVLLEQRDKKIERVDKDGQCLFIEDLNCLNEGKGHSLIFGSAASGTIETIGDRYVVVRNKTHTGNFKDSSIEGVMLTELHQCDDSKRKMPNTMPRNRSSILYCKKRKKCFEIQRRSIVQVWDKYSLGKRVKR